MQTALHLDECAAIAAWHFLPADRRLWGNGSLRERPLVEPGGVYSVTPPLRICGNGLHASRQAYDAIDYSCGPVVCRVEVWGGVLLTKGQLCAEHRRVLWMADAASSLMDYADGVAKEVMAASLRGGPGDAYVTGKRRRDVVSSLAVMREDDPNYALLRPYCVRRVSRLLRAVAQLAASREEEAALTGHFFSAHHELAVAAVHCRFNNELEKLLLALAPNEREDVR